MIARHFNVPQLLSLAVLLVAAAALRVFGLGDESLWADELASVQFAGRPWQQLWSDWMVKETNPPLYYSLLRAWMTWFGPSEAALRSLSVLAGLAAVGMTYVLGARLYGHRVALVACAFVTVASMQLAYSQEARAAIFTQLAALVAIWGAWGFVERLHAAAGLAGTARWLLVYVVGCVLALYFHTTMFVLPLLANVYVLAIIAHRRARNTQCVGWLVANLGCLAAWSWWMGITLQQMSGSATGNIAWIAKPGLRELLAVSGHLYGGQTLGALAAGTMALAAAAVARHAWRHRRDARTGLLLTVVAGAPLLLWVISQRAPILLERTLFWAQAPYFILLAAALMDISVPRWRNLAIAMAGFVLVADTAHWEVIAGKEPWREAVALMGRQSQAGDAVLVMTLPYGGAVTHYVQQLPSPMPVIAVDDRRTDGQWGRDTFTGQTVAPQDVRGLFQRHPRLWVLERQKTTPRPHLEGWAHEVGTWSLQNRNTTPLKVSLWASDGGAR